LIKFEQKSKSCIPKTFDLLRLWTVSIIMSVKFN